ncbi:hypothetical protein ABEB36_001901 [Hypothenemus hampei]|uniref:peptidylprolyl isomerase n=1 Tax=Hypothenemus hampei TaxID=57062 RepID=A0ABD1FJM7_HYPHA
MLKGSINFEELISTGTMVEIDPDVGEDINESTEDFREELFNHMNVNCVGEFEDENDLYESREPFTILKEKMSPIHLGVNKQVLRPGYGSKPQDNCIVRVHYNGYIEFNEIPFDCTYARKKPHTFIVGKGEVVPGLDIAVKSMNLNEKSQFLVESHLAYGSLGCLERIPPNATILFIVELLEIIESGASEEFQLLPEERKSEFIEVHKYCTAQCAKAKDLFTRNVHAAIKEYNFAVNALENAHLKNHDDQMAHLHMLAKLYLNLLVCYTKVEEPKKGCVNFNKLIHLTTGTDEEVSAKAYYNNAKCLRMLGEYDRAKKQLKKAHDLEPRNADILNEFKIIDSECNKFREKEQRMASAFIGN